MKTLACKTVYGSGGMGSHFAQIIEETRAMGLLQTYLAKSIHRDDTLVGQVIHENALGKIIKYPLRHATGLHHYVDAEMFDRAVARSCVNATEHYSGFSGQFLVSAQNASRLGFQILELHSPTAHVEHVRQQYSIAHSRWPIERSWLSGKMVEKQVKEYALADKIYVNSKYTWQSFVQNGVDESKLVRTHLQTNPRFKPADTPRNDETFRVVYVGSWTVAKGIPVLLEAFNRLDVADAELVIIGGWSTRGMKKYLEEWQSKEPRLKLATGDPLPYLQKADAYVHPSYQDGYGYAPMEAMNCGVPVIVTEDTGAKENVVEGENGYIVPTGSWESILDRLLSIYAKR